MTPAETWSDFWGWIKTTPEWDQFTRGEKQYLDKTNRQVKSGDVGPQRMKNTFDKYAPGRYKMLIGFKSQFEKQQ